MESEPRGAKATNEVTVADVSARVVRFHECPEYDRLYVDAGLPGHARASRILMGPDLAGEPSIMTPSVRPAIYDDDVWIEIIRCAAGMGAALHTHEIDEIFFVLSGRWRVYWEGDNPGEVELQKWDLISVPSGVMRGFKNLGDGDAYLLALTTSPGGSVIYAADVVKKLIAQGVPLDPGHVA